MPPRTPKSAGSLVPPRIVLRKPAAPQPPAPLVVRWSPAPLVVAPRSGPATAIQRATARGAQGTPVVQRLVRRAGAEITVDQAQVWLESSGYALQRGPVLTRLLQGLVASKKVHDLELYGAPELLAELKKVAQTTFDRSVVNMTLPATLASEVPAALVPLELSNLIGNFELAKITVNPLKALFAYERLKLWVEAHARWLRIAKDLGRLKKPVEDVLRAGAPGQQGMTIKAIWTNVNAGAGFTLGADQDRFTNWVQRLDFALGIYQNPTSHPGYEEPHLDYFSPATAGVRATDRAENVRMQAKINNARTHPAQHDQEILSAMQRPDASAEVTNTTGDGEVVPLAGALAAFRSHLQSQPSHAKAQKFELALSGSWGACDGCKKRIGRFVDEWDALAQPRMAAGIRATLRVTYSYLNPPTRFIRDWGDTTYGWPEDMWTGSAYFHTVDRSVVGA